MKKRILSIALVVCLLATALVSGTLAYFQDEENAKNTFVVGGVEIEITERKYENDAWVTLTPDEEDGFVKLDKLHPGVVDANNKVVYTKNTGDDAAYIRTLVAVENTGDGNAPVGIKVDFNPATTTYSSGITYHGTPSPTKINNVTISGRLFDVYVCEVKDHKEVLPNDVVNSLVQVNLTKDFTSADAEEISELEVYVFSQAIQSAGLTYEAAMAELGDPETEAATWFATLVPTTNK